MRNKIVAGFVIVLAVVIADAGLSAWAAERLIEHDAWVAHTHQVIGELEGLLADVTAAETGQRGFLLVGPAHKQVDYLKPYRAGAAHARERLKHLRELTRDNAAQQRQLTTLEKQVGDKLAELERTLALRKDSGLEAALAVVQSDASQRHMDAIRATVRAMQGEEEDLLRRRRRRAEASALLMRVTIPVGAALSAALLALAYLLVRRDRARRERAAELVRLERDRDVSAQQQQEQELRRRAEQLAEADRRKDHFLALLGHELRGPLAPLRNAVQLLELKGDEPDVVARARDIISRQTDQMARLVDELLDASRIARGKIQLQRGRLDLAALVRAAAEDHRPELEAAELALAVEVPATPLWVRGDSARLTQVIGNLLHNALKFTDPGGRVSVQVAEERGRVALSVEDTGVGIAPEALPALFEPFSQGDTGLERSKGGLGLGLSVVKGLAEAHGGEVVAASGGKGRGARFTAWLPLDGAPETELAPDEATAASAPAPARGRRKVLIIEDNRDAADSLRLLLSLQGFEAAVAYDGPAGLELAHRLDPSAVVCDLGLPGMSGHEVARALRDDPATAGALLVCVSGYGQEEEQRRAREAGFDAVLVKPVVPAELQRLLAGQP